MEGRKKRMRALYTRRAAAAAAAESLNGMAARASMGAPARCIARPHYALPSAHHITHAVHSLQCARASWRSVWRAGRAPREGENEGAQAELSGPCTARSNVITRCVCPPRALHSSLGYSPMRARPAMCVRDWSRVAGASKHHVSYNTTGCMYKGCSSRAR